MLGKAEDNEGGNGGDDNADEGEEGGPGEGREESRVPAFRILVMD